MNSGTIYAFDMMDNSQLVEATGVGHGFTHTDGGDLIHTEEVDGSAEIFVGGQQLTETGFDLREPTWVPGKGTLAVFASEEGDSQYNVLEVDVDTGEYQTVLESDFMTIDLKNCPNDPETVSLLASAEGTLDIYTLSLDTGEFERLVETEYTIYHSWSPDGNAIVHQEQLRENTSVQVTDVENGETRVLRNKEESEQLFRPELALCQGSEFWSDEGIVFASNENGDTLDIAVADPETGDIEWQVKNSNDMLPLGWHPDGGEFAYIEYANGDVLLKTMEDGTINKLTETGVTTTVTWRPDGEIVYRMSDFTSPGCIYVDGTRVVGEAPDVSGLVEPESVSFESHDGTEIPGLLYSPEDADTALVHAVGGPGQTVTSDYHPRVQALARQGIATFSVAYRGSRGEGRSHSTANTGDLGGDDALDLAEAARFLRDRGFESVGADGHSYGGYLVLMTAARTDALDGAINHAGPTDIVALVENARGATATGFVLKMDGTPEEIPEEYRKRSPINHVENIDVPTLSIAGENDHNVPAVQIERMAEELEEAGQPSKVVTYTDGHVLHNPEHRLDLIEQMAEFCDQEM